MLEPSDWWGWATHTPTAGARRGRNTQYSDESTRLVTTSSQFFKQGVEIL